MTTLISAPLPDLDLEESSIISVDTGDAAAIITRMVVHFTQDVPALPDKFDLIPPILAHVEQA
jgi:hypothetical protein